MSYFAPSAAAAVAAASSAGAPRLPESKVEQVPASAAVAQVSISPPNAAPSEDTAAFATSDDDAPVGPSEEEETAYLAEVNGFGGADFAGDFPASQAAEPEDEIVGPLPSLAALQEKISPTTLALLDELFRAKFTRVERVRTKDLKP